MASKLEAQPLLSARRPVARPTPPTSLRSALSLQERKRKNLHKRVKLYSKRLRAHWPTITAFLDVQSTVALASSCRRMKALLQDDRVWQHKYAAMKSDALSQLLVTKEPMGTQPTNAKQSVQRLVHARHVLDPTNSLQRRLREAERDVFRAATWQRMVRQVCRVLLAFALVLCCISTWGFAVDASSADRAAGLRPRKHARSSLKTFVVALDALTFATTLLLSVGAIDLSTDSGAGSALLLGLLQGATMAFAFLAAPSLDQILHAGVVFLALVATIVLVKRKQLALERDLASFVGKY